MFKTFTVLSVVAIAAALAATAPKKLWCNDFSYSVESNRPAIVQNGIVIGANIEGGAQAFDAKTGKTLWSASLGLDAGSQSPSGGTGEVFFTASGTSVAVNESTGDVLWTASAPAWSSITWRSYHMPVVGDVVVNSFVIGGSGAYAMGNDVATGARKWLQNFASSQVISIPIASGTQVVVANQGAVNAFDAASGTSTWNCTASCCANQQGGALAASATQQMVFFPLNGAAQVGAYSYGENKCTWTVAAGQADWAFAVTPDVNTLISGDSSVAGIYAIDVATGKLKWSRTDLGVCGGTYCHPDMTPSGLLVFGTTQGTVYGVDSNTGAVQWNISQTVSGAVSTDGSYLVVPTTSQLCAYEMPSSGATIKNCTDPVCKTCGTQVLPTGCAAELGSTSVMRSCTSAGLDVTSYDSSDCSGTPTSTRTYVTGVCYPNPFGSSIELLSC